MNRLKDVLTLRRLGIGIAQIRALLANGADLMNNAHATNVLLNHLETLRTRQSEVAKQIEETASIVVKLTRDNTSTIPLAMGAMAFISSHVSNWSSTLAV